MEIEVLGKEGGDPEEAVNEGVDAPVDCPLLDVGFGFIGVVGELKGDENSEDEGDYAADTGHGENIIRCNHIQSSF